MKNLIRWFAHTTGRGQGLYKRLCQPSGNEWAQFLARWGGLHSVGRDVIINMGCNITDPMLVSIGNNVTLSSCTILGHDGVIKILNARYNKKLDSVGPVIIKDNCFVGYGAIVMPRVTIGPDSIVAAGAIVTKDVPPGVVVGGNPARILCRTSELVERLEMRCAEYPWISLVSQREGAFDPDMEPLLMEMRVAHFFKKNGA